MKYYLIISIFLISSCKKNDVNYNVPCNESTNDITSSKSLIIGTWQWVSELNINRITGQNVLTTPQSEGYSRQLEASTEILNFYKNNIFEQKYRYDFVVENTITNYPYDSLNILVFKDFNSGLRTNHTHFKICNDTLTLNFQVTSSFNGIEKWAKNK